MNSGLRPWRAAMILLGLSLAFGGETLSTPRRIREVSVQPGDDLMAIVAKNPPGTTFRFAAGLYRLQSIIPKDGDSFLGRVIGCGSERVAAADSVFPLQKLLDGGSSSGSARRVSRRMHDQPSRVQISRGPFRRRQTPKACGKLGGRERRQVVPGYYRAAGLPCR